MTLSHVFHPRAPRFPLEAHVRFRAIGEQIWREGLTVNASRTGVLLRSIDAQIALRDRVEFILTLPRIEGAPAGVRLWCTGGVARVEGGLVPARPSETTFALTIGDDEFGQSEGERLTAQPRAGQIDA